MATNELLPLVYNQLRRIAQQRVSEERIDHSLQATGLVHEVYLRLMRAQPSGWASRAQFVFAAAEAMRRILIEHARHRATLKEGGDRRRPPKKVPLGVLDLAATPDTEEIVAFDEAVARLEMEDPQAAQVVRLRFFAGLSIDETAESLGISARSVNRDWAFARAKLHLFMQSDRI
jgi:RNA polymerase sigma factor (TIGR02999 family)